MKSPGTSQLDRMRSKNTVTPLQSHDCYHGTKPLQSSHPEEWQWQWLERQGKEFRFYATEVQSLESTHFLLIWSNTADRRKKHCLCLLICVSTNLANWCIQVFWSMKNHQTLQLETSRQKLEHLFYSLKSMLQICCHLPLITCPPFHTSYFPLWQKALTYIRKKLQRFWQFDSLGLLVLVSLFLSQSFLKIISFQQWKKNRQVVPF